MAAQAEHNLILASGSAARRSMLENAGLVFSVMPSQIDEAEIKDKLSAENTAPRDIAMALAKAKALDVAQSHGGAIVIGADQVLAFEGEILDKAQSEDDALEKLKALRGKTHTLISAVSVAIDDDIVWEYSDEATMTMHDFDDDFLDLYCQRAGEALTRSVGAYELESYGSWLFSAVEGSFFTVLGMPLLPLLDYLRNEQRMGL